MRITADFAGVPIGVGLSYDSYRKFFEAQQTEAAPPPRSLSVKRIAAAPPDFIPRDRPMLILSIWSFAAGCRTC